MKQCLIRILRLPCTVKCYSKASSGDYEVCPAINLLELQTSYRYEEASTSIFVDDIVAEELADDEQIYEDPGHKEETIYLKRSFKN